MDIMLLTGDMKLVLGLIVITMVMFLFERIRADIIALIVLVLLGLTKLVAPENLFEGFSSNAVINIIATMILGAGLDRTGALNRLAYWLMRRAKGIESRVLLFTTAIAGINSSVIQNASIMALYLPVVSRLSARTTLSLSRMLLPLASAIVMGGALTMVGSSPLIMLNDLLVSSNFNLPPDITIKPLGIFAPLPIGIVLLLLSLGYFHFFGNRYLSHSDDEYINPEGTKTYFAKTYDIDGDLFELTVGTNSQLIGMLLSEAEKIPGIPLILALKSGKKLRLSPPSNTRIWTGDVIGVMGIYKQVRTFTENNALRMSTRLREFSDLFNPSRAGISEAVIPPTSSFVDKTIGELQLRKQKGISVLAINRNQEIIRDNIRELPLRTGDMLVLHSIWSDLTKAVASRDFIVVTDYPKEEHRPHKFKIGMAIFIASMILALSSQIPTPVALMAGVAGMLVTGVLKIDEAYAAINWKTVFLIACLIPMGWAINSSGTAAWIASHVIEQLPENPPILLLQFMLGFLTTFFSMFISHISATIMIVPIAINLAIATGSDPTVFALITALSASNNLLTASNPVMSMITGPGEYSWRELWRVGMPLTLLYIPVVVLLSNLLF